MPSARQRTAVVGAGSWGTTLAKLLGENGQPGLLWARRPELAEEINASRENTQYLAGWPLGASIEASGDLERVCRESSLIILAVPSHGVRAVAAAMAPFLDGEHLIVHTAKGLEEQTFKRMTEVLREETAVRRLGVLAGPNLALELARGQPAGTLVASRFGEVVRRCQAALSRPYFRIFGGDDVVGAEVGGMFKNIVAVAAGVVEGLAMGDNTKAFLMTRGLHEMARVGVAMGANVLTFSGMAGIGDLIATCGSPLSRNHQVGLRLAQGQTLQEILGGMRMVAEGVKATRAVYAFAQRRGLRLPIVEAVHAVLYEARSVSEAMAEVMSLEAGSEFAGLAL